MSAYRDEGHGHVWERPDGLKARCGGPGICRQCADDQMRVGEAKIFTDPIDIAILLKALDGAKSALKKRDDFLVAKDLFTEFANSTK